MAVCVCNNVNDPFLFADLFLHSIDNSAHSTHNLFVSIEAMNLSFAFIRGETVLFCHTILHVFISQRWPVNALLCSINEFMVNRIESVNK